MDEMYGFDSREGEYVSSKGLESMTMIPLPLPLPVAAEEYDHHDYHNSNLMMMMINNHHRIHPTMFVSDELLGQSSALSHESASVNLHNQRDDDDDDDEDEDLGVMKAKIASHPSYPKLLQAYIDCRKVGAPPEIVSVLDEIRLEKEKEKEEEEEEEEEVDLLLLRNQQSQSQSQSHSTAPLSTLNIDPHLHHFMESYCHILVKLKSDLSRPFDEATSFLNQIQAQLLSLSSGSDDFPASSGEELIEIQDAETKREDRQLKEKLLRMYGSHISSLKLEFSKKKKKGKLPEEGRQTLLNWWNLHSKWPYPTEADKIALAETTGLDQKQINNWFINQRKRHWKSPDNMHLDGVGVGVADNLSPNFLHH